MNPLIFNLLLGICGACVGAFINWAIYNLCYEERGSISPWNAPRDSASRRKLLDYVPIVGWLSLSRDDSVHGKLHWIRPLLIELTTAPRRGLVLSLANVRRFNRRGNFGEAYFAQ